MALTLFIDYLWWHYTVAPKDIIHILGNYFVGFWQKFYIIQHAKTLFSPWHRLLPKYVFPSDNFSDKVTNFITDLFIRCIAAIIRLVIIAAGLAAEVAAIILFLSFLVAWLLWPALSLYFIGRGLFHIFGI